MSREPMHSHFFPLIIAIRFGRLLIEDMKKKESKEE